MYVATASRTDAHHQYRLLDSFGYAFFTLAISTKCNVENLLTNWWSEEIRPLL